MKEQTIKAHEKVAKNAALAAQSINEFYSCMHALSSAWNEYLNLEETEGCEQSESYRKAVSFMLNQITFKAIEIEGLFSIKQLGSLSDRGEVILEQTNYASEPTDEN